MRTCLRCKGPTTRPDYCGICDALLFGLSDEQLALTVEHLKATHNAKALYGPKNEEGSRRSLSGRPRSAG